MAALGDQFLDQLPHRRDKRSLSHMVEFAADSSLEGSGFERPVPRQISNGFKVPARWVRSTFGAVSSEQLPPDKRPRFLAASRPVPVYLRSRRATDAASVAELKFRIQMGWTPSATAEPGSDRIGGAALCHSMRDYHDPDQDRPRYRKECLSGSRCRRQGHGCHSPAAAATRHPTVLCFSAILPYWH